MSYTNLTYNQLITQEEFKNKIIKISGKSETMSFQTDFFNGKFITNDQIINLMFSNKEALNKFTFDVLAIFDEKYNLEKIEEEIKQEKDEGKAEEWLTYSELVKEISYGEYYQIEWKIKINGKIKRRILEGVCHYGCFYWIIDDTEKLSFFHIKFDGYKDEKFKIIGKSL